jgi:hypothetical protein
MNKPLKQMLRASIEAQRQKALLTLQLLSHHSVGIGDHSTDDYYKNAEEALAALTEADDESGEYVIKKDGKIQ